MTMLLDRSRVEIKLAAYGTAPATALSDPGLLPKVQEYRRISGSRMIPLDREGMKQKIPAADHHVSRKVDGEFTVLILRAHYTMDVFTGIVCALWVYSLSGTLAPWLDGTIARWVG